MEAQVFIWHGGYLVDVEGRQKVKVESRLGFKAVFRGKIDVAEIFF